MNVKAAMEIIKILIKYCLDLTEDIEGLTSYIDKLEHDLADCRGIKEMTK